MLSFFAFPHIHLATRAVFTWDVFALAMIVLAWVTICGADPYEARRNARLQDSSRTFFFVALVVAATASLIAVGFLLGSAKDIPHVKVEEHIALSITAIFLSWTLIHTLFALRYAHYYYHDALVASREEVVGGLLFPEEPNPDYFDFAYFSFIVGMTCQVSDVQISSRRIRRITLLHGLIAFVFNTAILAMFVNIVAGLV